LLLHKELSEFIIPKNFYNELEKTLQKNINISYMHLQTNTLDKNSWILLLPDYVVYTFFGGYFFKLSIIREGECLQFFWQEFGKDFTFTNCNTQGQETLVTAVTLTSSINHYAIQTVLAVIALNAAIVHANTKEKKVLTIRFDYSWFHSRNA
ncbi:16548_t:CDS:2, partial [Funneliformis mosseae]